MQFDRVQRLLDTTTAQLRFSATNSQQQQRWKGRVRAVVARLARVQQPVPLQVRSVQRHQRNGLIVEDYEFSTDDRSSLRGTLLLPTAGQTHSAVLVCPGQNARLAAVTGAEPPDYPDRSVADQLARRGLAALTIDYGLRGGYSAADTTGERDQIELLAQSLALYGRSPLMLLLQDALSAIAWLESLPSVGTTAIFGHSLGGILAVHVGLLTRRPRPIALASCLGRYTTMFGPDHQGGASHALPGIMWYADLPDLVAALVPAPLHIQHGERDLFFPVSVAREAARTVQRSYELADASGLLSYHELSMGHGTDVECLAEFLQAELQVERPFQVAEVPAAVVWLGGETRAKALDRIDDALSTGALTMGPQGREFETRIARWTGAPHNVATGSGTSALEIAMRLIGVEGRTVLVPANTFFATASAVERAGARVEFVDIELEGLGMDAACLRRALAEHRNVAAVVVVHIGGIIAPVLDEIRTQCDRRGIPIVEDAAHGLGSRLDGEPAGSLADFAAFSMYPTKVLTCGEGGLLCTRDKFAATTAKCYRDQGKLSFRANVHSRLGSNWRMSELHASLGLAQLERLEESLRERQYLARQYDELLDGIETATKFPIPAGVSTNYYKYIVMLSERVDRGSLRSRLRDEHGVSLAGEVYSVPCCAQPFFAKRYSPASFPNAFYFCRCHICLPLFPNMQPDQVEHVVRSLRRALPD